MLKEEKSKGGFSALIIICIIIAAGLVYVFITGRNDYLLDITKSSAKKKPVNLTLFSDISDWNAPEWSLKSGTLTKVISDNTDVSLDFDIPAQGADKELSLLLVENKLPDIITVKDQNIIRQLIASGKVWDLNEFFSEYKPNAEILKMISKDTVSEMTYRDGSLYAIPTGYCDDDLDESRNTIIWNKSLLKKIGADTSDVKTKSGMLSVLKKAEKYRDSGKSDLVPVLYDGSNYKDGALTFLAFSFGASELDSKGKYQDIWGTDGGKEALDFTNTLLQSNILRPEYLAYDMPEIQKMMSESDVLCYIGEIPNYDFDPDEWVSTGAVTGDSKEGPVFKKLSSSSYCWPNTFVSKSCTDLPGAAEILDYIVGGKILDNALSGEQLDQLSVFANPIWGERDSGNSLFDLEKYKKIHKLNSVYSSEKNIRTYDSRLLTCPIGFFEKNDKIEDIYNSICDEETEAIAQILSASSKSDFEKYYSQMNRNTSAMGMKDLKKKLDSQIKENRKRAEKNSDDSGEGEKQ